MATTKEPSIKPEVINEYIAITGKSTQELEQEFNIRCVDGIFHVPDKNAKSRFNYHLQKERDYAAYLEKVNAGIATWTHNEDGEWCVLLRGKRQKIGTMIDVEKKDGTINKVIIKGFICRDSLGSYYRVEIDHRVERASTTNLYKLNKKKRIAKFIGSTGEIYLTTEHCCTCPDFMNRRLPCKHIYRLINELEIQVDSLNKNLLVKSSNEQKKHLTVESKAQPSPVMPEPQVPTPPAKMPRIESKAQPSPVMPEPQAPTLPAKMPRIEAKAQPSPVMPEPQVPTPPAKMPRIEAKAQPTPVVLKPQATIPPAKKKKRRWPLVLVASFALIFIIAIAASGENPNSQEESTVVSMGETIEVEPGLFLTLNNGRSTTDGIIKAKGTYLILDCTYENKSDSDVTLTSLSDMYIRDADGHKYTSAIFAETTGSLSGTLAPGRRLRGEIAFDVRKDCEAKYFCYKPFLVEGFTISRWDIAEVVWSR